MRALAVALATVGGVGYAPIASGTVGTLVALPLVPALSALGTRAPLAQLAAVCAIVALAVWAAGRAEKAFASHDSSRIVIDEVAGLVVAGLFVPPTWLAAAVVFLLFRACDVLKPFPAGLIDARVEGGLGVVGDDVVAGIYAGLGSRLVLGLL